MIIRRFLAAVSFAALLLTSCAVAEIETEQAAVNPSSGRLQTRSTLGLLTRTDSLRLIYEFQTNKRVLLHNYLLHKNGEYILCISRERALSLGVDSETYDEYVAYVVKLNER